MLEKMIFDEIDRYDVVLRRNQRNGGTTERYRLSEGWSFTKCERDGKKSLNAASFMDVPCATPTRVIFLSVRVSL